MGDEQRENGVPTPEERFQELRRESAEWSERIEKSVRELDRVTKAPDPAPSPPKPTPA